MKTTGCGSKRIALDCGASGVCLKVGELIMYRKEKEMAKEQKEKDKERAKREKISACGRAVALKAEKGKRRSKGGCAREHKLLRRKVQLLHFLRWERGSARDTRELPSDQRL